MASVPYGSYFYGRSRYGTPGYHFAACQISASATVSNTPTVNFNLQGPETIAAVASVAAIGNHKFHGAATSQQNSDLLVISERLKLGIPLPITETSSTFAQGIQIDQAGVFILPQSGLSATGNQIDLGATSISAASNNITSGLRIKLGALPISAVSGSTQAGLKIKLGQVNPLGTSSTISVGTQIDLGAVSSAREISNVSTLNPQYTTQDIPMVVHLQNGRYVYEHTTSDFTNVQTPMSLKPNYTVRLLQDQSSNTNYKVNLSMVPDGPRNTSRAHISLRKDASNNEYLQIMAASTSNTPGGTGSNERRTLYFYDLDTNGGQPQFTGSDHPYVFPTTTVTKDPGITATIGSVLVSGFQMLTINGKPVYQYNGDTSADMASGVGLTNWKGIQADGSAQTATGPGSGSSQTYAVTVASGTNSYGSGNKYYLDGVVSPTINFVPGNTYTFDQSDPSNANHPLRLSTTPNGTHGGGSEYTTQVTTYGTPGSSGAYTSIVVTSSTPNLNYYCQIHSGMGGTINVSSGSAFVYDSIIYPGQTYYGTPGQPGAYLGIAITASTPTLYYFNYDNANMGGIGNISTDVGGVESVFTVVGQSALSPNSGLSSIGVRRYFGVGNVAGSSSISADGELKWIIQNVPQTEWTEQKLANTP